MGFLLLETGLDCIHMEPKDDRLTIWNSALDHTTGFTDFGLESLSDFILDYRANHPEVPSAPAAD